MLADLNWIKDGSCDYWVRGHLRSFRFVVCAEALCAGLECRVHTWPHYDLNVKWVGRILEPYFQRINCQKGGSFFRISTFVPHLLAVCFRWCKQRWARIRAQWGWGFDRMGKISGSRRWKIFLDFGMKELFQYRVSLGSECCSFLFFFGWKTL